MKDFLLRFLASRCTARWCLRESRMDGLCGKHWVRDQELMYALHLLETQHGISNPDEFLVKVFMDKLRREGAL